MQKSFVERIFPPSSSPLLPTSERESRPYRKSLPSTPSALRPEPSSSPSSLRHASPLGSQSLRPTPLSASIIHHNDPLLPVDRAAKALQKTIQSLLDAQSDGLSAGLGSGPRDDVSSADSVTPTPSVSTPSRGIAGPRTTPVRQPVAKKITLRGARKGLMRSMRDLAQLKEEELNILDSQSRERKFALEKVHTFEDKRSALQTQVDAIKQEETSTSSEQLHKEAQDLDQEIRELEDRLFELKAKQRHVLARASQVENSIGSKLSSYTSSLDIIEREIKQYLKRPPMQSLLPEANSGQSMYDLRPERRTLTMAKEQWTNEQTFLTAKRTEAARERAALQEGFTLWAEIVERITVFEKGLRAATLDLSDSTTTASTSTSYAENRITSLLPELDSTISALESALYRAESQQWNLLICCIGPELEALHQGRTLLRQTLGLPPLDSTPESEEETDAGPDPELMNGGVPASPGESNRSLEDTMEAFGGTGLPNDDIKLKGKLPQPQPQTLPTSVRKNLPPLSVDEGSSRGFGVAAHATNVKPDSEESEEDDPGPDFLLSHA